MTRPIDIGVGNPVSVRFTPRERDYLRKMGGGNIAAGIRKLIAAYNKDFYRDRPPALEEEKEAEE